MPKEAMLPEEIKNAVSEYVEHLFEHHKTRVRQLELCRKKMEYRRARSSAAQTTKKKQRGYRESGPSISLLEAVINLGNKIDEARSIIKTLNKEEKEFIKYRYFMRLDMNKVAEKLHRSRTSVYAIRKEIMVKASLVLYFSSDNPKKVRQIKDIYASFGCKNWSLQNPFQTN